MARLAGIDKNLVVEKTKEEREAAVASWATNDAAVTVSRATLALEERLKAAIDPHDLFCGRP